MKIKNFINRQKYIISLSLFIFCFSLFIMLFLNKETDYFWHIKAGEVMLKNHSILKKDVFSWFMMGKYWMSHEWLFEVILAFLKNIFGVYHIFIYAFVCLLSLFYILFITNKDKYLKNILFSLIWIVCGLIMLFFIQARPHMISFCFLALTVYFTYDLFINENSRKIYFLPLVTILWSNFHGGSSNLSYLFCILFLVVGLFKFNFSKIEAKRIGKKQIIKYLVISIICMGCICINPHGFKMFLYPYSNMADSLMISSITEWQPTVLSNTMHYPYFVFIIFIFFIMLFSKKKISFIDLVMFGLSVFLGLKSVRFWAYTYIICTYIIFNYINKRKSDKGSCLCIVIFSFILFIGSIKSFDRITKTINKTNISSKMINVIKKESPKRLYNLYDYGGELINNDIKVFVDGRADLYSKYNLDDYIKISTLKDDYIKLIDKYDFDYFFVNKKCSINTYLKYSDNYEVIYKDKKQILYKKKVQP